MSAVIPDPCERILEEAFTAAGINFRRGDHEFPHLDFYLPDYAVHVEVKRLYTERTETQMARVPDVIVVQGLDGCRAFAKLIRGEA